MRYEKKPIPAIPHDLSPIDAISVRLNLARKTLALLDARIWIEEGHGYVPEADEGEYGWLDLSTTVARMLGEIDGLLDHPGMSGRERKAPPAPTKRRKAKRRAKGDDDAVR